MTIHNAPPVVYPLGRSRFQACLLLGLWLAGLLALLLWFGATRQFDGRIALALLALVVAGAAAYSSWNNTSRGQLAWDGEVWRWESPSYQTGIAEQKLSVLVDLQHRLLLRLENQAHARVWIWAERSAFPERWLDLRRALFSPHKAASSAQPHDMMHTEPQPLLAASDDLYPDRLPADATPIKP